MKRVTRVLTGLALAACMMITAGNAMASESGPKFKLGVGTYALIVAEDSSTYGGDDLDFYGGALVGTACITKHVAIRGAFYATENDDYSGSQFSSMGVTVSGVDLEVNGADIQLLLGTNFYEGWNLFGGVGAFFETAKITGDVATGYGSTSVSVEEDLSGAQVTFGVGYSWSKVALDYVVNVRDTSDYEDLTGVNHDYAVSGGINLSYIF